MSTLFNIKSGQSRTFKPKKVPEGTKQWQLKQYAQQTLGSGNLRTAVKLPEGEDLQEWIAVHVVDFFNHVNMLYGTISEFCTPTELSAPAYVEALMSWTQSILDDEKHFPQTIGKRFPPTFMTTAKTILRRLFRIYAHIYHAHFDQICALGIEAHLNTNYRHFLLFVDEFALLSEKDLVPLEDFNKTILNETGK
ncbi:kinase regulator [Cryptococcus deuterogattii LA55]|nr:kinase regulator [Cryptococcus deuterogattii LA55]KIR32075.1 kinase regulator [Cryptococcus deuterogattii MMRL2647]KIR71487.1 kinase regulator [Cryptococcus deuterogattii CA1014]KIR91067.1 kinase regulator [Cryptococcus deuterogattii CBS 10090]KIR96470.1 kinase regulator [Cryptococcus deuterogattii 2001/935-1]